MAKCRGCGGDFALQHGNQRRCRRGCSRGPHSLTKPKRCEKCGQPTVRRGSATICRGCHWNRTLAPCPGCGELFWPWANGKHPRQFHSAACAGVHRQRRARTLKPATLPHFYGRFCSWCATYFETKRPSVTCCSADHQRRIKNRVKKAQRRGLAKVSRVSLPYLFRRDRGRCGLCGKAVNPRYVPNHPRAGTTDHIVPVIQGGTDEARNLQLAHFGCNSAKRDRICGSQLRLLG